MKSRALAPKAAQAAAQVLTAWAVLVTFLSGRPDVFTVAFAVTAFLLPLRHDGTDRGRALTCFSASLALGSILGLSLMMGLLGGGVSTETWLLLTATVLFSLAGGLHWVRQGDGRTEDEGGS